MALALAGGFVGELAYANTHQNCPCCASNKCHANTKCHDTATKACACNFQTAQLFLSMNNILPKPVLTGYLAQNLHFAYVFLSTKDIFHPPRS